MIESIIGVMTGVLAGMGLGGGSLLIPVLCLFLHVGQRAAQAANIIGFIPAAVVSLLFHRKNGLLDLKLCMKLAVFGILGALLGSYLAILLKEPSLRRLFGLFLAAAGLYELFRKQDKT